MLTFTLQKKIATYSVIQDSICICKIHTLYAFHDDGNKYHAIHPPPFLCDLVVLFLQTLVF